MQRRPQNPDESKTSLNIDRHHNFSQNRGHIILAIPREPIRNRGAIPMNLSHRGTPDKFISEDEILELLTQVRHNPTTDLQHEKKIEPTTKTRLPTCSNSNCDVTRLRKPSVRGFQGLHPIGVGKYRLNLLR